LVCGGVWQSQRRPQAKAGKGKALPVVSGFLTQRATPDFGLAEDEYGIRTTGCVKAATPQQLHRPLRMPEKALIQHSQNVITAAKDKTDDGIT
jgi:hypothetical protein